MYPLSYALVWNTDAVAEIQMLGGDAKIIGERVFKGLLENDFKLIEKNDSVR